MPVDRLSLLAPADDLVLPVRARLGTNAMYLQGNQDQGCKEHPDNHGCMAARSGGTGHTIWRHIRNHILSEGHLCS
jgi:hypothetical protein